MGSASKVFIARINTCPRKGEPRSSAPVWHKGRLAELGHQLSSHQTTDSGSLISRSAKYAFVAGVGGFAAGVVRCLGSRRPAAGHPSAAGFPPARAAAGTQTISRTGARAAGPAGTLRTLPGFL